MAREDGRLEVIQEANVLRAPTQSTERPYSMGLGALCQLRSQPAVGVGRADGYVVRRDDQNRVMRAVWQGINFVSASDAQCAPSVKEKWHVCAQAGAYFDQAVGGNFLFRQPHHSRSEEHTSELQSPCNLVCRLLLEKKTGSGAFCGTIDELWYFPHRGT